MSSLSSSLSHHHYTCHYHISTITSSLSHQHYNISTILVAILVHKCIWGVSASPWFQSQNLKSGPILGGHLPLITWGSMVNEESMTILVTIVINIPITITLSLSVSHYQYPYSHNIVTITLALSLSLSLQRCCCHPHQSSLPLLLLILVWGGNERQGKCNGASLFPQPALPPNLLSSNFFFSFVQREEWCSANEKQSYL